MPAQKVAPAPVITPTKRLSSSSRESIAAPIACAAAVLIAFLAAGPVDRDHQDGALALDQRPRVSLTSAAIRIAPSSRIVSPLSIGLSMMAIARRANSSGWPSRRGCGVISPRESRTVLRQPGEDRGVEDARGDGHDPDQLAGQVAGGDQGQPDDAGLRRRVGQLADLPLEGGDRRGEHADAALAVDRLVGGHPRRGLAEHVEGADQVDPDDLLVEREVAGVALLVHHPHGAAAPRAVHEGAQRGELVGGRDGRRDRLGVGDVRGDEAGLAAELGGHLGAGRRGQVDEDRRHALLDEAAGGGQGEPGGPARDDGGPGCDVHAQFLPAERFSITSALAIPPASHIVCSP